MKETWSQKDDYVAPRRTRMLVRGAATGAAWRVAGLARGLGGRATVPLNELRAVAEETLRARGAAGVSEGWQQLRAWTQKEEAARAAARAAGVPSSGDLDEARSAVHVLVDGALRAHPAPSTPLAAHAHLDLTRYAPTTDRDTLLAPFTAAELAHAVQAVRQAGVQTADLYRAIADELTARLHELEARALMDVSAAFAERPAGVSATFWRALGAHAAERVPELPPKALADLVHWCVQRGVDCKALAREAAAKLLYTLSSPTWASDADLRALVASFWPAASAAGALSPALIDFVRQDLLHNAHLYAERDVRALAALLGALGHADAPLEAALRADADRRARAAEADAAAPYSSSSFPGGADALYGRAKAAKNALRA